MIHKKIIDNQLFVYYNGVLFYKRWLKDNSSIIFEKCGHPTWSHQRDEVDVANES